MNFTFTQRHKIIALALIVIGIIGITIGALNAPMHGEHKDLARTWASLLLGNFFFMVIALAGIAFVAIQYVAEVGWSAYIKRIPLAMSTYIPFAAIFMILIFIFGHHDIYPWTHDIKGDHILEGKKAFLNIPFFTIRMILYFLIWGILAYFIRKNNILEDTQGGTALYFKNRKLGAAFLVLYLITSSMMAWDFIMSIDPHWFSTLFGWYVFASGWVSGLSMMGFLIIYLKRQGLMPGLQESHLHDTGKFMFAFSIFWTYLWFAQFMLIWFANLPEEVAYFIPRLSSYRTLFIINFVVNFITPFLVLMTRDAKRKLSIVATGSIIILVGHWLDMYLMIMPGIVGDNYHMGWSEFGATALFGGIFMFVVLRNLAAVPLVGKNHPLLEESLHHNI